MEFTSVDGPVRFDGFRGCKSPAGTAMSLVLHGGDDAWNALPPVEVIGDLNSLRLVYYSIQHGSLTLP